MPDSSVILKLLVKFLIRNYNCLIISGQITDFQFFSEVLYRYCGADALIQAQCPKSVSLELHILDEPSVLDDPL